MPGKYANKRNELLHSLSNEGWSDNSTGDIQAPCGFVSWLHLVESELGEAYWQKIENVDEISRENMLGDWIIVEDDQGFVTVTKMEDAMTALEAIEAAEKVYATWESELV